MKNMTVTLKQREMDKDTLEQHVWHKYGVAHLSTTTDGYGNIYLHLTNTKGQRSSFNLRFFDFECHSI